MAILGGEPSIKTSSSKGQKNARGKASGLGEEVPIGPEPGILDFDMTISSYIGKITACGSSAAVGVGKGKGMNTDGTVAGTITLSKNGRSPSSSNGEHEEETSKEKEAAIDVEKKRMGAVLSASPVSNQKNIIYAFLGPLLAT